MANNDGQIVLGLDMPKTVAQINADIKKLQKQLAQVKATGKLDSGSTVRQINAQISALQSQLKNLPLRANINTADAQRLGQTMGRTAADAAQNALNGESLNIDRFNADVKTLINNLNNFSSRNTGFDSFKTEINGVEVSLDSLISRLSAIDNITDLETIRSQASTLKTAFSEVSQINGIELSMDNGHGASQYQNRIQSLIADFEKYGITTEKAEMETSSLQQIFDGMSGLSGQELINQADKFEQEFKAVKISVDEAKISYDRYTQPVSGEKASSLINKINTLLSDNSRITEDARSELQGYAQELSKGVNLSRWNEISGKLEETENSMSRLKKLGALLKDQMSQAAQSLAQSFSLSSAVTLLVSKTQNAISELKEVDTLLTEISKSNDKLSGSALEQIGNDSFDIASKYGKSALDYLSSVQEAFLAGYENAEGIAELSLAAQGAGDMTAELANQLIAATDQAYEMNGSVSELTRALDGMNYLTGHNAVNMDELSEAMSLAGSTAASCGVDIDEAAAALGTMLATTQQSGSEAADAFKAILLNIRQVSDEEEGIDAEGLIKFENACNALNVRLKETKNGVLSLRNPMEVLRELSIEYNQLEESDVRKTNLLSSVGDEAGAIQLDALLGQWDAYETMLQQYENGTGSMAAVAEKTANSWEGSMNRLSNTWTDIVQNIANSDGIKAGVNALNSLLSVLNNVTNKLGSLGTISLGAGLLAGIQNVGSPKMFGFSFV